jgi:probable HAF family extracellular repeat protein
MVALPFFDGGPIVQSDDGSSLVGTDNSEAHRWTAAEGVVGLGHLGGASSLAFDVSANGSVVVGGSTTDVGGPNAFVWYASTGMLDLREFLMTDPVLATQLSGWHLTRAKGITPNGSIIVGRGLNQDGQQEAWMADLTGLTPPPSTQVPEPSTLLLLGTGLAYFITHRLRQRPRGQA